MKLRYLEEARRELLDAVVYDEACAEGLGQQFLEEVKAGESAILAMPNAWGAAGRVCRRKLLQRFPYGLVYRIVDESLVEVVAVLHLHRKPGYWRRRIP